MKHIFVINPAAGKTNVTEALLPRLRALFVGREEELETYLRLTQEGVDIGRSDSAYVTTIVPFCEGALCRLLRGAPALLQLRRRRHHERGASGPGRLRQRSYGRRSLRQRQ